MAARTPLALPLRYYGAHDGGPDPVPGYIVACCEEHARTHADAIGMVFAGPNQVDPDPTVQDAPNGCDACGWDFEEDEGDEGDAESASARRREYTPY